MTTYHSSRESDTPVWRLVASESASVAVIGYALILANGVVAASPLGPTAVGAGLNAAFAAAVIGGAVAAAVARVPGKISGPRVSVALLYATLAGAISRAGHTQDLWAALSVGVLLAGVAQAIASAARLAAALLALWRPATAGWLRETIQLAAPYSLLIALQGAVDSGLTARAVADRTGIPLSPNRALLAQGVTVHGTPGDTLFVVLLGRVEVRLPATDREPPRRLAAFGPGGIVGEAALLTGQTRAADVVCVRDCRVGVLTRAVLQELQRTAPDVHAAVMENLARHLARVLQASSRVVRL